MYFRASGKSRLDLIRSQSTPKSESSKNERTSQMFHLYPRRPTRIITGLLCCALLIVGVQPVTAQTDYAKLTVVVKDLSKNPVSNATVTLHQGETEVRRCTTDAGGLCVFASLVPSTYEIRVRSNAAPPKVMSPAALNVELMPGQNAARGFTQTNTEEAPGAAPSRAETRAPHDQPLLDAIVVGRQGERATSKQLEDLPAADKSERPLIQRQTGVVST